MFLTTLGTHNIEYGSLILLQVNPCIGPSPRIKIYIFLWSKCTEELMSTPKIITLQPNPPLNEKAPFSSNPQYHIQNICTYRYQYF